MAKKQNTRDFVSSGESQDGLSQSAVAEPESNIYAPDYRARRWWLLGIRIDEERNMIPFHNTAFGGVAWQQGTQNQVMEDGWLGLDRHRARLTRQQLSAEQVIKCVASIKQMVVRWKARQRDTDRGKSARWAADIVSLEHRIKTYDKKKEEHVPAGYRYQPGVDDVPVSSYLILIPRGRLKDLAGGVGGFSQPELTKIPTMLDLDPSLIPDRMSKKEEDFAVGDEPW